MRRHHDRTGRLELARREEWDEPAARREEWDEPAPPSRARPADRPYPRAREPRAREPREFAARARPGLGDDRWTDYHAAGVERARGAWGRPPERDESYYGRLQREPRALAEAEARWAHLGPPRHDPHFEMHQPGTFPGPHAGKGPRGYRRPDERIREDVCDILADDDYVDASDIDVSVSSGEVTLAGTVDSRATKRRAEDVVEHVRGVVDVHNALRVRPPGREEIDIEDRDEGRSRE